MAERNSSSPIHFFSTTMISRDHADRPPPNDASAMWLNVHASSSRETFSAEPVSLMDEFGVVREVVLVVGARVERIRRLVVVRQFPVGLEGRLQPRDDGRFGDRDAEFAPEIEGT